MLRVGLVGFFFLCGVGKHSFSETLTSKSFLFSSVFLSFFLSFLDLAMEDLTKQWNCLSLSEREGEDLCIKKDRQSKEYIIAAFFLTRRALNMEAVARTFKPLWRAENGFKI